MSTNIKHIKEIIFKLKLLPVVIMLILVGCEKSSSEPTIENNETNTSIDNNTSNNIAAFIKVYPTNIILGVNGLVKISTVLEDEEAKAISNTEEYPLQISFKERDNSIAQVNQNGYIKGITTGNTTITVDITDITKDKVYSVDINVTVENIAISRIVISPNKSTLNENEEKEFSIEGISSDGILQPVQSDKFGANYDSNYVEVYKYELDNSSQVSQLKVKALKNTGYTTVIPTYSEGGIVLTGDPLLLQFNSIVQLNTITNAGYNIDFDISYNSNTPTFHTVHTNSDNSKLYYEYFNNGLNSQTIDVNNNINYPNILTDDKAVKIYAKVNNTIKRYKSSDKNSWDTSLYIDQVSEINSSKHISVVSDGIKDYILYMTNEPKLLLSVIENESISTQTITNKSIAYLGLDAKLDKNNILSFVYYNNTGLYYATYKNNNFYTIKVSDEIPTQSRLIFSRTNQPLIASYIKSTQSIKLYTFYDNSWNTSNIDKNTLSNQVSFNNIDDFHITYDLHNALKIVIKNDKNVYYIKSYQDENDNIKYRADTVDTNAGTNKIGMALGNDSNIHIITQDDSFKQIRQWDEPNFFNYKEIVQIDTNIIDINDSLLSDYWIDDKKVLKAILGNDIVVNQGEDVILSASQSTSISEISNYEWKLDNTILKSQKDAVDINISGLGTGTGIITLTITDIFGNNSSDSINLTIE